MTVGDLKIGDLVTIKLAHWVVPQMARVIAKEPEHDQLHGEFMHNATRFRKVKASGKETHMYTLADHTEPEILTAVQGQSPTVLDRLNETS